MGTMRLGWMFAMLAVCLVALGVPVAHAATPSWSGKYSLVRYAVDKKGTSVAAGQTEQTFSADYVFSTVCSAATCVATANNGPKPNNPTISVPSHYTWDGTRWVERFDFQWDCFMGEGVPKAWAPAKSWAFYAPQSDGSLRGTWHTDIASGPCQGSVEMPVAAFRA
jgi:hypothetical protein